MSKLFNLKEWLTLDDAARHLSIVFGEEIVRADVLRLALDGHLQISVNFVNHTKARSGKIVGYDETVWGEFPAEMAAAIPNFPDSEKGKPLPYMKSLNIDDKRFINLEEKIVTLRGVWDLPMIGGEQLDIEHQYQMLTGGPSVTLETLDGAFVERSDGTICQLQEDFDDNEYQAGSSSQLEYLERCIASDGIEDAEAESLLNTHKELRKEFLEKRRKKPANANYCPAGGLTLPSNSVSLNWTKDWLAAFVLPASFLRTASG